MTIRLEIKLYHLSECQVPEISPLSLGFRGADGKNLPPSNLFQDLHFLPAQEEGRICLTSVMSNRTFFSFPFSSSFQGEGLRHESEQRFKSSTRLNTVLTSLWAGRNWRLKAPRSWTSSTIICDPRVQLRPNRGGHTGARGVSHLMSEMWQRVGDKKETEADKRERVCDGIRKRSWPRWQ